MNISGKDGVVTLGGREFNRVKNGLDEAQIKSFIDELVKERDELAQSQHHTASLKKLAETTIVEADRLAKQIKAEASEQAKAESAAVIDKAREQAQQMAERKQAEILKMANEKADAIQSQAEKKTALLLESEREKIRDELRNFLNQQFSYLLEKLENLKQQATAIQADFDNKLSQAGEEKIPETTEIAGEKVAETMEITEERDAAAMKEDRVPDESLEAIRDVGQNEKSFDLASILKGEDRAELGEPQWEVEILPPVEITKVMEVMTHLDQLHQVANTEMIVPQIDTPSILVFLREEMDFIDMLRTIPAVAHVEEVTTDGDAANGKPRKARIGLSGNAIPQEKK
jgi:cell division septum initiation protein DivIVA